MQGSDLRMMKWSVRMSHVESEFNRRIICARMEEIFSKWKGTEYGQGQQAPGKAVDCVRFVCAVLDELYGVKKRETIRLPQDAAFHDRRSAVRAMNSIVALYDDVGGCSRLKPGELMEPGDILVTGAKNPGGPGHAIIAGTKQSHLWHIDSWCVSRTGTGFSLGGSLYSLYRIYRPTRKDKWLR